jgi:hypothetical protein
MTKFQAFMIWFRFQYDMKVMPHLYTILMWVCMAAGSALLIGDLWRGMGLASAISLYYAVRHYYFAESEAVHKKYYGGFQNVEPDEAQGK